jgi:hypothetical protein
MVANVGLNDLVRMGQVVQKATCKRYDYEPDLVAVHDIGRRENSAHALK